MNSVGSYILIILFTVFSCNSTTNKHSNHSVKKLNIQLTDEECDNPDVDINCSFRNMPEIVTSKVIIPNEKEIGDRLILSGIIYHEDKITPYKDVIMYVYQTDSKGFYSKNGTEKGIQKWHGKLHGWCKTDAQGYYEIQTIRPAPYPTNTMPAHIHPIVKKPNNNTPFYLNDFVFKDDTLVNEAYISSLQFAGGNGIVELNRNAEGIWIGERDIVLPE